MVINIFLAVQDKELRKTLGNRPEVPVIYVLISKFVLDKPNKNTFSIAIKKDEEITNATPQELKLVEKTLEEQKPLIEPIKRKYSKPKGPNPKSVKKSKKVKLKKIQNIIIMMKKKKKRITKILI